jgi:hypothetical protein
VQIGEETLRLRNAVRGHDEEPCGKTASEGRDERGVSRTGKAGDAQLPGGSGQRVEHTRERGKTFDRVEQTWKGH